MTQQEILAPVPLATQTEKEYEMADGKITVTLKADKGYEASWLVLSADTVKEMQGLLEDAHAQDLFTAVGRADDAYKRGVITGKGLGARTVSVENAEEEKPAPAEKAPARKSAAKKDEAPRPEPDELEAKAEEKPAPKKAAVKPPAGVPKPAWAS